MEPKQSCGRELNSFFFFLLFFCSLVNSLGLYFLYFARIVPPRIVLLAAGNAFVNLIDAGHVSENTTEESLTVKIEITSFFAADGKNFFFSNFLQKHFAD